jgi:ring-1,2-phenylacetyl-CoA epoxidase subunit PaaD
MMSANDKQSGSELESRIWAWLAEVEDPEIPVVSVVDLGIVRDFRIKSRGVEVDVSPTYSGCPATEVIEDSIVSALEKHGMAPVRINRILSPPWTTEWISEEGRQKLRDYGIAPPEHGSSKSDLLRSGRTIACPQCNSLRTTCVSEFGSTACKAAYKCDECLEPFEYFKCI